MENPNYQEKEINKNDEINLIHLLNIFLRNKKFISYITILSFFISVFSAVTRKKIWEGQFEIVLNNKKSNSSLNRILSSSNLASLSGLTSLANSNSTLKTQLEILKSSSVLMPVFEFLKKKKTTSDPNYGNLEFSEWRRIYLQVNLKKGTSVLKFNLREKEKDLILPALSMVSKTYQEYSGKTNLKNNLKTEKYLKDQIEKYQKKSSESFTRAQEFAIKENLYFQNYEEMMSSNNQLMSLNNLNLTADQDQENISKIFKSNSNLSRIRGSIIALENARVKLNNRLINIDNQLNEIEKIEDVKQLQYIGSTIPGLVKLRLPQELENIQKEIAMKKSIYTEKDIALKKIIEKRDVLSKVLKENAIGYLKADRISTAAALENATRPKEILIKYRELLREAERDDRTLIQLENSLTFITLEKSRSETPWDLITKPTLFSSPAAPRKRNYAIIGILIGLSFSYLYSFFKEKKSGIVYEPDILESLLNTKILDVFKIPTKSLKNHSLDVFTKEILNFSKNKKLKIIISSAIKKEHYEVALDFIFKDKDKYELIENLNDSENNDILFVADLYLTEIPEVNNLKNRLDLTNKKLFGILLLKSI